DANGSDTLDAPDGAAIATTTTASGTGAYSFGNLGPGTYFVQEVVPSGSVQTTPAAPGYYTIHATAGLNSNTNNFANFQKITISGAKFTDLTGNGLSADDTPLAGVTINLFKESDGNSTLDAGDGAAIATAVTATTTGTYSFSNLGP